MIWNLKSKPHLGGGEENGRASRRKDFLQGGPWQHPEDHIGLLSRCTPPAVVCLGALCRCQTKPEGSCKTSDTGWYGHDSQSHSKLPISQTWNMEHTGLMCGLEISPVFLIVNYVLNKEREGRKERGKEGKEGGKEGGIGLACCYIQRCKERLRSIKKIHGEPCLGLMATQWIRNYFYPFCLFPHINIASSMWLYHTMYEIIMQT